MTATTDSTGQLRRVLDSELRLGAPVQGDLMDIKGRVLLNAGQMLDAKVLTQVKRHSVAGLYVNKDFRAAETGNDDVDDDSYKAKPGAQIIRELEEQHDPKCKRKGFKQRRHERRPWSVALTVAVEERSPEGIRGRNLEVVTQNISAGGFAFMYNQYLHAGTKVHVQFDTLPHKPYLVGLVRNCCLIKGRKHRVGVQFIETKEHAVMPDFSNGKSALDCDD